MTKNTRTVHTVAYRHNLSLKWLRWSIRHTHTGIHFDSELVEDITLASLGVLSSLQFARSVHLKENFTVIPVKQTITVEIDL